MDDYYEENCREYNEATVAIDPSSFLAPLLARIEPPATILDVGCGSGRDMLWFKERGFRVTGFERSSGLAELARKHSGCPVTEGDKELINKKVLQKIGTTERATHYVIKSKPDTNTT
jgi:SAM-dependent methyltransferase